jgi:hypothetical protein
MTLRAGIRARSGQPSGDSREGSLPAQVPPVDKKSEAGKAVQTSK